MVDTQNKLSIVKQCRLLEIHRGGLYYKAKTGKFRELEIMQLLDQQYFNTPFYGCRTDVLAQRFRVL
jgi:putative transposase